MKNRKSDHVCGGKRKIYWFLSLFFWPLTTLDSVLFSFVEKPLVLMNCQLLIQDSPLPIFAPFTTETFVKIDDFDGNNHFCNKSTSLFFDLYVKIMPKMKFLENCQILPWLVLNVKFVLINRAKIGSRWCKVGV